MIRTERLLLRKPTPEDVEEPPSFLTDLEVMRWLGGIPHDPAAVVRGWLDDWEAYPTGKFVVERHDGAFVGRVGLNYFDRSWRRSTAPDAQPELGWVVAREHWGCGYATEAARAVRAWAALPRVVSAITLPNVRSIRVAEKLGCAHTDEVAVIAGVACDVWVHPS